MAISSKQVPLCDKLVATGILLIILFADQCLGAGSSVKTCRGFNTTTRDYYTQDCSKNFKQDSPQDHIGCFVSWTNGSGVGLQVINQGCWLNGDRCMNVSECVAYGSQADILFCCCDKDECNINYRSELSEEKTSERDQFEESNIVRRAEGHPLGQTVLFSVVPILAVVMTVIAAFFIYRRYQRGPGLGHTQLPTADPCSGMNGGSGNGYLPNSISQRQSPLNIQLLELKAHGRYGSVWKAQLPGQFVAVKIFPLQDKQSWMAELAVYSLPRIKHDNILRFISCEERDEGDATKLWLITEYHDRGSLCDFLKGNTISWGDLCKIGETMACGLAYLHDEIPVTPGQKGKPAVAHRDLKSKNVLLKQDLTACIADFGLALKFEPSKGSSETHPQVGTRRYMAPEVLEGAICFNRDSFLRIDMYACGLIIWELMSRCTAVDGPVSDYRLPFEAEVGQQPSLEDMQTLVVTRKMRPALNPLWHKHPGLYGMIPTVQECWDQDAEARLSAGCVQERIRQLARTVNSQLITDQTQSGQLPPPQQQQPPQLPPPPHSLHYQQQQNLVNGNNNNSSRTSASVILTAPATSQPPPPMYEVPPSRVPPYTVNGRDTNIGPSC